MNFCVLEFSTQTEYSLLTKGRETIEDSSPKGRGRKGKVVTVPFFVV